MNDHDTMLPGGQLVLYENQDLDHPIKVMLDGNDVWLPQKLIADLYQVGVNTVNYHIKNIYADGEQREEATIRNHRIVQNEGGREISRDVAYYNLDMILAVGYRVRSLRGVQFRQWATQRLSEYLVKGFTLDDERLKGRPGVTDYFDELLERIRDIRASEARVYLMIRNIFALASDYRKDDKNTGVFFATMQNKMHYAATKLTAAEIIKSRADASLPNMGLSTWKGGRVTKTDVGTAKNYLSEDEIKTLNRITVMFLDMAQFRAENRQSIHMADWEDYLDKFLDDLELPVLDNAGSITHKKAVALAQKQYDKYAERRREEELQAADAHYVEDLRTTAETMKKQRKARRGKK